MLENVPKIKTNKKTLNLHFKRAHNIKKNFTIDFPKINKKERSPGKKKSITYKRNK